MIVRDPSVLRGKNTSLLKWLETGTEYAKTHSFVLIPVLLCINLLLTSAVILLTQKEHSYQSTQQATFTQLQTQLQTANQEATTNAALLQQLSTSVNQLANTSAVQQPAVLGTTTAESLTPDTTTASQLTPSPAPLGILQLSSVAGVTKAIYDSPAQTNLIETVTPGKVMLYYKKENGWYQVDPPEHIGAVGWIQQDQLIEIPNVTEIPH